MICGHMNQFMCWQSMVLALYVHDDDNYVIPFEHVNQNVKFWYMDTISSFMLCMYMDVMHGVTNICCLFEHQYIR